MTDLVSAIDAEISRLTTVRTLLDEGGESSHGNSRPNVSSVKVASTSGRSAEPKRRGRPKGSKNRTTGLNPKASAAKRRVMSPAAKERIAAAHRARWAKQKGSAVAKKSDSSPAKRAAVKAAGRNASVSVKGGKARNLPRASALKKSATAREAAAKVIPAKRLSSKISPKQNKKNASPAPGKKAAGRKSHTESPVADPPKLGSGAPAEVQASS